jgi:membrane protease YdiL (CAAX protease family)
VKDSLDIQVDRITYKLKLGLIFTLIFPTILTYIYFVILSSHSPELQKLVYGIGKSIQFSFPFIFSYLYLKDRFKIPSLKRKDLIIGGGVAIVLSAIAIIIFNYWVLNSNIIEIVRPAIIQKLNEANLTSKASFIAIAFFYSIIHSLMEEYYWRWFVFRNLNILLSNKVSLIISSIGFMSHHVIVIGIYFGFESIFTYIFSAVVAMYGGFWAWLYEKSGTLYGAWLSHAIIDILIFYIGYQVVFN